MLSHKLSTLLISGHDDLLISDDGITLAALKGDVAKARGDTFYIFSDGYADQFGGERQKKLMTKRLKQILLSIRHLPMPQQENFLNSFIEEWKAGEEQVDDILILGVKFE